MDAFAHFLQHHRKALRRIANSSQGEHSLDDVQQEAWLIADHVAAKTGRPKDFADADFQSLLIAFLYQQIAGERQLSAESVAAG